MTQRLHLVFGGVLIDETQSAFLDGVFIVAAWLFLYYSAAYDAWRSAAQRTVDDAHTRYFIAPLHRLRDEEAETSSTEELSD